MAARVRPCAARSGTWWSRVVTPQSIVGGNIHTCHASRIEPVDVMHHRIGHDLAGKVAHDLVHGDVDKTVVAKLDRHGLYTWIDLLPLRLPVGLHGFPAMDVATLECPRPPHVDGHPLGHESAVTRVEGGVQVLDVAVDIDVFHGRSIHVTAVTRYSTTMTRPIDLERRAALLHAVAGHLINKGHARDSLREIATGVGTSARMLMHHFGTRERLIGDALKLVRDRQLRAARQAISPGSDAIVTLRNLWRWYARKDTRRYFLLFEDVELRERISPSANSAITARLGTDWRPLFAEIFRQDARFAHDADLLAHLVVATLRGFARDRMSGASVSGQRHAFQTLIDMIGARATEEGRGGIHHDRACRRGDAGRCIR